MLHTRYTCYHPEFYNYTQLPTYTPIFSHANLISQTWNPQDHKKSTNLPLLIIYGKYRTATHCLDELATTQNSITTHNYLPTHQLSAMPITKFQILSQTQDPKNHIKINKLATSHDLWQISNCYTLYKLATTQNSITKYYYLPTYQLSATPISSHRHRTP